MGGAPRRSDHGLMAVWWVSQEERRVVLEQLAVEYFGWGWADEPSLEERVEATAREVEEWKRRRTASLTSTEGGAAEGAAT